jgi:titin
MKYSLKGLRKVLIPFLIAGILTSQSITAVALTQTKVVTISFAAKSATVTSANSQKLSKVVDRIELINGRDVSVLVTGYTRASSNALDRQFLLKRVNNVISNLEELGLDADFSKNLKGRVKSSGPAARKVVVSFKWNSATTPTPLPTAGPLAAPTNLIVSPSDRALSIAFTPPTLLQGQNLVTGYEYQLNSDGIWRSAFLINSNISISGLLNSTNYSVQIRAVNVTGKGLASTTVTGTPVNTVPSTPTNLSVTAGFGQLAINFIAGFNGGTPIIGYEYTINGGTTWISFPAGQTSSPLAITGLSGGTNYSQIKIRAINVNGKSPDSATVSGTPLLSAPSAPTNLIMTPGDGQLTLSFSPANSNGSPILRYEFSLDGGTTFSTFPVNYLSSPVIITGLTNRALYPSIRLRSVNSVGPGAVSASVSGTPSKVPTAPTISSVVAANQSLTVSFVPGNDFGVVATNYQFSIDGGTSWEALSPADTTSPITITGLTNGVTYSALRIRVVNAIGVGDRSELFSGTPVAAPVVPAAPVIVSLLPGDKKLGIVLSASISTGGSPLIRYEYSLNGGSSWNQLTLSAIENTLEILGLNNGTIYSQIRLRSVNSVGPSPTTSIPTITPNP